MPLPNVVYKAFFGRCPDVRFYSGTPEENISGVAFLDAVLVWSNSDANWQSRIETILIDPSAGRAARDTDSIPLRSEQLDTDSRTLSLAAQWEKDGILAWDFFPLDDELMAPIPEAYVGCSGHVLMRLATHLGQKSRALIPALWRIMNHIEPGQAWQPLGLSKTLFQCGTAHIHIGRPRLSLSDFDDPNVGTLVLAPHRTGRGPNGVWVIYRGPKHRLAADEDLLLPGIDR
ncbi:hypothetical protein [Pseudomonas putida]